MNSSHLAAAALLSVVLLSACSPQQMLTSTAASVAVSATTQKVSPANISRLQMLCGAIEPLAEAATMASSQTEQVVGQFGVAYCGKLLAGVVLATTDANTESWLSDLLASLRMRRA
jgi:hypothetical protein